MLCSMLASNLSTRELEVKCKICGSNCCVDFNQRNCKRLQTVGKLTQKLGGFDTVNQPLVRF